MKKWIILGLLAVLYAAGVVFFFKWYRSRLAQEEHQQDISSVNSGQVIQARSDVMPVVDTNASVNLVVYQTYEGSKKLKLPFEEFVATFIDYTGSSLNKDAVSSQDAVMKIVAKGRVQPEIFRDDISNMTAPNLGGSISFSIPGKGFYSVVFDSVQSMLENDESDVMPQTIEDIFNEVFVPSLAEIIGQSYGASSLIKALRDPNPVVQNAAGEAIVLLAEDEKLSSYDTEQIIALIESMNPAVREVAVRVLGEIDSVDVVSELSQALKDDDPYIRAGAIEELGHILDPTVVPEIIPFVRDPDPQVRDNAVQALGKFRSPTSIDVLIEALSDEAPMVRAHAVDALNMIEDEALVEKLLAAYEYVESPYRTYFIRALGNTKDEQVVEPLISALENGTSAERDSAAQALKKLESPLAVDALIKALGDEDLFVRSGAASALERIPNRQAIDPLINMLEDEELARLSALTALKTITGRNFQYDVDGWKAWWEETQSDEMTVLPFERDFVEQIVGSEEGEYVSNRRIEWPVLKITGAMRGTKGRQGVAFINGRIYRQGEQVGGLELLDIGDHSIRLRYFLEERDFKVKDILEK